MMKIEAPNVFTLLHLKGVKIAPIQFSKEQIFPITMFRISQFQTLPQNPRFPYKKPRKCAITNRF